MFYIEEKESISFVYSDQDNPPRPLGFFLKNEENEIDRTKMKTIVRGTGKGQMQIQLGIPPDLIGVELIEIKVREFIRE